MREREFGRFCSAAALKKRAEISWIRRVRLDLLSEKSGGSLLEHVFISSASSGELLIVRWRKVLMENIIPDSSGIYTYIARDCGFQSFN